MQVEQAGPSDSVALFVIGMAGSGKSTLVRNFSSESYAVLKVNLDPAVFSVEYPTIYDIRKDFPYKKVMQEYSLGPNGAIMTALNLLSSQPDKLLNTVLEAEKAKVRPMLYLVDVPGQIESFAWSASSAILTTAFSTLMPTALVFVTDLFRCQNPNSFLSNVLFAQSIQTRLNLPLVLALNKIDAVPSPPNQKWLADYEQFDKALNQQNNYLATLSKSIVLYMSQFFEEMVSVLTSGLKGVGFDSLIKTGLEQSLKLKVQQAAQRLKTM